MCSHTSKPDAGPCSMCAGYKRVRRVRLDGNRLYCGRELVRRIDEPLVRDRVTPRRR